MTIRDFRHGIQRFIFCQRKTRLIRFLIRHSSLRFVVTNETRRFYRGQHQGKFDELETWHRERERKRERWGEMFDKIAVTRILIFPCRLTIISSEIFAYLEISLMVILVIFICLFDTSMQNGGKKMEEDCYFMIFVQSRLNYLSDYMRVTILSDYMRKIGRIVVKFLYSLSLSSSVSWSNVLINLFVVFSFRKKMKKDYYFMIII